MQIKRFLAENMSEVLKKVKEEMGPNAVILSSRSTKKKGRRFGVTGQPFVEVTAALDSEFTGSRSNAIYRPIPKANKQKPAAIRQKKQVSVEVLASPAEEEHFTRERQNQEFESTIRTDLNEIKTVINSLNRRFFSADNLDMPESLLPFYDDLLASGIDEELVRELVYDLKMNIGEKNRKNNGTGDNSIESALKNIIRNRIRVGRTLDEMSGKKRIMALIGPTGVGKTTSIAKIAANLAFSGNKVGLITLDTYRIAAVEQLKIYARIIDIPVEVVSSREEMADAIDSFRDRDYILIDTAGRSHLDNKRMAELSDSLKDDRIERHLVLSACTDMKNLAQIIMRFTSVDPLESIIFTKLDETSLYGSLYSLAVKWKVPVSYLTMGQNVPEDIEEASQEKLADYVLRVSHTSKPEQIMKP